MEKTGKIEHVNWYKELSMIDVSKFIEKKNGLSYLSWMSAWDILKKRYPLSFSTVYEYKDTGSFIFPDPIGGHVKTGVTIVWEEEDGWHEHEAIEYLPIFDFRNKTMPVDSIDAMSLNKTIQRSLTKCIARLGLGAYVYAGEDLPMEDTEATEKAAALAKEIATALKAKGMSSDEKKKFTEEVIVPLCGEANFMKCSDIAALEKLLVKVKE